MQSSSHKLSTPIADSVYLKNVYVKNSFAYSENDDSSGVKSPIDVKLAVFWSLLWASRVSCHNKVLWYYDTSVCGWLYIYIYMYEVHRVSFQTFFVWAFKIVLKIQYLIAIHLMRWLTNFSDFSFKWTTTAAIGIPPTKAWLSLLVIFKNAIWHFRRMIRNKIAF